MIGPRLERVDETLYLRLAAGRNSKCAVLRTRAASTTVSLR